MCSTLPAPRVPLSLLHRAALAAALVAPAAWAVPFTDNNNGTVTDQATGLVWDQCPWGQSGANCATGTATPSTWAQALAAARTANGMAGGYKGHTDWRLPNINELESLVHINGPSAPYIDAAFPGTPANGLSSSFWSSTTYVAAPAGAWYVVFSDGGAFAINKTFTYSVRLVRGGQSFDALDPTPPVIPPTPTGVTAIPTLGQWALALLAGVLGCFGVGRLRRRGA